MEERIVEYRYFQPEIETMDREQMRKLQGQKLHGRIDRALF